MRRGVVQPFEFSALMGNFCPCSFCPTFIASLFNMPMNPFNTSCNGFDEFYHRIVCKLMGGFKPEKGWRSVQFRSICSIWPQAVTVLSSSCVVLTT